MPQFNDPTVELSYLEKDDVLMSGSPTDFANIKAQNVFNRSLTRTALQTLISASGLIIGQKYTITNAVTSTLVLVVEACAVNKLDEIAVNSASGDNVSYDITTDIATAIQQTQINGTGFVKATGTTLSYDNNTYLTTIEGIAAGGELEGNYASPTLKNSSVIGKVLTGLSVTGSAVVSTDSVLTAVGKLQNQVNGLAGGVEYQGTWNASTNTPTLTSSVGTQGFYYVVSVAGSTNLNGITTWELGDWAIFNGSTWQKVDNTDAVVSVNGYTGIVTLSATDVSAVPTSAISGTSGTVPLFGASNTLGNSIIKQVTGDVITNNATDTGEHFIVGGSARVNGTFLSTGKITADNNSGISILSSTSFGMNMYFDSVTGYMYLDSKYDSATAGRIYIRTRTNGTPVNALWLNGNGDATFGSALAVTGAITGSSSMTMAGDLTTTQNGSTYYRATANNNNAASGLVMTTGNGASLQAWLIANNISGASGELAFRDSTLGANVLTLSKGTGVATFSSSVTIGNKTTTQINALTPATGMVAFNTTLGTLCFYDGAAWKKVTHSAM
jgi:hypothetical protein